MPVMVLLMLLIGTDPYPTFQVLNSYQKLAACEAEKAYIVQENGLTKEQAKLLMCLPIAPKPVEV